MRKVYKVPAGSQEWLDIRAKYITATEMPCLLGLNPYKTAAKMLADKEQKTKFEPNIYTRRGKILEPAVMQLAKEEYGLQVDRWARQGEEEVIAFEGLGVSCTPDGVYIDQEFNNIPVECKTVKHSSFVNNWVYKRIIPAHYLMQLYMQVWLTDVPKGYLIAMAVSDGLESCFVTVHRCEELEQIVRDELNRYRKSIYEGKKFRSKKKIREQVIELIDEYSIVKWCNYSQELIENSEKFNWNNIDWEIK